LSRYRRASLGERFGYMPGEQPRGDGWLKLNTNESPLPPSPAVAEAVRAAAAQLHLYPDPFGEPLRSALAARHAVAAEQVLVANGADQVLDCCFRAFVEPGDTVVLTTPTYSLLPVLARLFSARAEVSGDCAEGGRAVLRALVNPNTPTGRWVDPQRLERELGGAGGVVVIDEAYCDFAPSSAVPLLQRHPSWVVVRTFSKSYALAGLRVGYAVASRDLIADLAAVKDSYPVDRCAIAGAMAALADSAHHRDVVETVRSQREALTSALLERGWQVTPSHANFVFAVPPPPLGAWTVAAALREQRVLVRTLDDDADLSSGMRITVGTAEMTRRLLDALDRVAVA
jgi:histidinol-phosphate aminotransferase